MTLKKLAIKENLLMVRFWGKIFGTEKDYLIAQTIVNTTHRDKSTNEQESIGTGANKYTFFVTNSILDDWQELPQVTPDMIKCAR
jgi:radial spoke head protein 4A